MNQMNAMKNSIQKLICAGFAVLFSSASYAADMGDSLIRDYPVSLTLPENRLELSLDYLRIDDATDIFNIRDKEINNTSGAYHSDTLSDMTGFRMFVNYGLFEKSALHGEFTYRDMDFGLGSVSVISSDISWKQNILNDPSGAEPFLAIDFGFRYNYTEDQTFSDVNDINKAMNRFVKGVTLDVDNDAIRFIRDTDGVTTAYSIPADGKPAPAVSNENMNDFTPYVRIAAGKIFGVIFPNLFAEFGKTKISSGIDFSLKNDIPEEVRERFPNIPVDLDRREDYIRTGFCLLWKYPYMLMGRIEYNYMKMFRGSGLDYMDDNHIVKADLNWFVTPSIILNVGGVYYHRQFNGVIPFLYNEYTQTAFDHKYGRYHMGITYLFGR